MLREIMVASCAISGLNALVSGSTNCASRRICQQVSLTATALIFMKECLFRRGSWNQNFILFQTGCYNSIVSTCNSYCHVYGCVTYKTCFGLIDWIYCTLYIHAVRDYRQHSAIAILHTFQFSVTHALGYSAFTSRILATDVSQCHCHFKSHVKSSCHSLIPFLPLFCRCQFRRLDSTRLDYSRLRFHNPLYSPSTSKSKSHCD
jgi:hypothetical protein